MLKTLFAALPLLLALPVSSPAAAASPLEKAAAAAAAQVAEKPSGLEELFSPEFFREVSLAQITSILSGIYRQNGAVTSTRLVKTDSVSAGHFIFETRDYYLPAALSVNRDSGRINGLFFGEALKRDPVLKKTAAALAALPGRAGLEAVRLGGAPETLEALNGDEEFAVGSVFELYVLGALLRAGVPWSRVFTLDEADRSLPPGAMAGWPEGAPATAYSLALGMVADSDNTAADVLISGLGRRSVEAALTPLGHSSPGLLRPFLRTSELFRLRADSEAMLKYLNLPAEEKYGFLDRLRAVPLDAEAARRDPFGPASAEWRASPADLCRLMSWLLAKNDALALGLLARGQVPGAPEEKFPYAGYKGGAGPGVTAGVWLLRDKASRWTCVAAAWNDPGGGDGRARFLDIMGGALAGME